MLRHEECLQHLFEGRFSTAGISNVVRQQIPDHGTGDSEGPTAKCGAVVPWYVKTVVATRPIPKLRLVHSERGFVEQLFVADS